MIKLIKIAWFPYLEIEDVLIHFFCMWVRTTTVATKPEASD